MAPADPVASSLAPEVLAPAIARALGLPKEGVQAVLTLLAKGGHPTYIARYRGERTGDLSVSRIEAIQTYAADAAELEFKKEALRKELQQRGLLQEPVSTRVDRATGPDDLEDIRFSVRKRRRGPSGKAKAHGLAPVAAALWAAGSGNPPPEPVKASKPPKKKKAPAPGPETTGDAVEATEDGAALEGAAGVAPDSTAEANLTVPEGSTDSTPDPHAQSVETQSADAQSADAQSADAQSADAQSADAQSADAQSADAQSADRIDDPDAAVSEGPGEADAPEAPQVEGQDTKAADTKAVDPPGDPMELAASKTSDAFADREAVLAGARTIVAEDMAEHVELRQALRDLVWQTGKVVARAAPEPAEKANPVPAKGGAAEEAGAAEEPSQAPVTDGTSEPQASAPEAAEAPGQQAPASKDEQPAETPDPGATPTESGDHAEAVSAAETSGEADGAETPADADPAGPADPAGSKDGGETPSEADPASSTEAAGDQEKAAAAPAKKSKKKPKKKAKKKPKKDKLSRYAKLVDFKAPCKQVQSGRVLALWRAEREGAIEVRLEVDTEKLLDRVVEVLALDLETEAGKQLRLAAQEAWDHGLGRAIRTAVRNRLKRRADDQAIDRYRENLRQLLLAPPYGHVPVLAVDPGFQNGCRVVALDAQGAVLAEDTVFPLQPKLQLPQAKARIAELCRIHGARAIAVGTGNGGRDLERICREIVSDADLMAGKAEPPPEPDGAQTKPEGADGKDAAADAQSETPASKAAGAPPSPAESGQGDAKPAPEATTAPSTGTDGEPDEPGKPDAQGSAADPGQGNEVAAQDAEPVVPAAPAGPIIVASVDEDAAALFASSRPGKDEFKDRDAALRRAASLGRRFQDPLWELSRIDLRKLGLGQHQHEVSQDRLRAALEQVLESCINDVGVDLNRADDAQLAHVAGIGQALAKAVVTHREANGPFRRRAQLLDVPGFAGRVFEQAAGFLLVPDGDQPLDRTRIHPSRYSMVTAMARDLGVTVGDLLGNAELVAKVDKAAYIGKPGSDGEPLGESTATTLLAQLAAPGQDVRPAFELADFQPSVANFAELTVGMDLEGVVTHLAGFGAFVDVGIRQEGLVHVSELTHNFVTNPGDAVHVGQRVKGRVIEIDPEKKRFAMSLKALEPAPKRPERRGKKDGDRERDGEGKRRGKGGRGDRKDRRDRDRDRPGGGKKRGRKGPPPKGGHRDGKRPSERTLGFRMDLSDLAKQLEKN